MNNQPPEDHKDPHAFQVPLASFQDLVVQYHHRLLSLEAELKEQSRSGGLKPAALAKRVKQLRGVHKNLASLQRLCLTEIPDKLTASSDVGLPFTGDCTPAELAVCEQFLAEREKETLALEAESAVVYCWLAEAAAGRTGILRLTLRLTKLRRMLHSLEKRMETMQVAAQALTGHTEKLLASFSSQGHAAGRTTLASLMAIFQQLDGKVARVASLRAAVKKEANRTQAMAAWLAKEKAELEAIRPRMQPPTPLAMTRAALTAAPARARHQRRRALLEQFWDEVAHKGLTSAVPHALAHAALLIRKPDA